MHLDSLLRLNSLFYSFRLTPNRLYFFRLIPVTMMDINYVRKDYSPNAFAVGRILFVPVHG